jgi:hypothetical protein
MHSIIQFYIIVLEGKVTAYTDVTGPLSRWNSKPVSDLVHSPIILLVQRHTFTGLYTTHS